MSSASGAPSTAPRESVRSIALIVLSVLSMTVARTALAPIQELLRVDLGIDDSQVALLQGLAIALPIVVMAFPLGRLVDRRNRSRLILYFGLAGACAGIVTAFSHDFVTIFAARMVVGVAFAGTFLASLSLVADFTKASARGRAVMLIFLGQVAGRSISFAAAGALVDRIAKFAPNVLGLSSLAPWRLVELLFSLVILVASLLMVFLQEPLRQETGAAAQGGIRSIWREFVSYRRVLLPLLIGIATINMADTAAEIWAVPVLTRNFRQTPADFGAWMSLVTLIAGVGGSLAGGFLSDLGQKFIGRRGVVIGAILGAAVSIPCASYPLMPSVTAFAVVFAVFLVSGSCNGSAAVAAGTVLIPNEIRGVITGVFGAISVLVASGIAPLLVTWTAQFTGTGDNLALPLSMVGGMTSVIGTGAFIICLRAARVHSVGSDRSGAASGSGAQSLAAASEH